MAKIGHQIGHFGWKIKIYKNMRKTTIQLLYSIVLWKKRLQKKANIGKITAL